MQNKILTSKLFRPLVRVADVLFSLVIVGPLVILYWVTTWKICDIYITPDEPKKSALISFAIGFTGQFIFMFYQDAIAKILKFQKYKIVNLIVSKVYALLFAQTCISFWRGIWKFCDMVAPIETIPTLINLAQNVALLMITKTFKNSYSTPFVLATDQMESDYEIPTFFKRVVNKNLMTGQSLIFSS